MLGVLNENDPIIKYINLIQLLSKIDYSFIRQWQHPFCCLPQFHQKTLSSNSLPFLKLSSSLLIKSQEISYDQLIFHIRLDLLPALIHHSCTWQLMKQHLPWMQSLWMIPHFSSWCLLGANYGDEVMLLECMLYLWKKYIFLGAIAIIFSRISMVRQLNLFDDGRISLYGSSWKKRFWPLNRRMLCRNPVFPPLIYLFSFYLFICFI